MDPFGFHCSTKRIHGSSAPFKTYFQRLIFVYFEGAEDPWILLTSTITRKGSMDLPLHSKYTFIALFGYISRLRKIHGSFSCHRSSKKDPWIFRILGNNYEVISRFVLASNSQRMTQITGEFIEFIAELLKNSSNPAFIASVYDENPSKIEAIIQQKCPLH